jgi:hypothetical protein
LGRSGGDRFLIDWSYCGEVGEDPLCFQHVSFAKHHDGRSTEYEKRNETKPKRDKANVEKCRG